MQLAKLFYCYPQDISTYNLSLTTFTFMDWIEVTGLIGSALSSITFIPQVLQAWKTKSVGDLNLSMMVIVTLSTMVWLVYGFGRGALPVIICNAIIFILSLVLLYFKFTFPKNKLY